MSCRVVAGWAAQARPVSCTALQGVPERIARVFDPVEGGRGTGGGASQTAALGVVMMRWHEEVP